MLPSSLKSIYRQYKADTDSVATWLATTAKANGYVDDTGNGGASTQSTRLKGKARKQAKAKTQAQGQSGPGSSSASKAKYVLRIKDFEPMANFIAKLESIALPEELAISLERVIWVRKTFVDMLVANGIPTSSSSDKTHSYFADVLEKVGKCLQPLVKAPAFKAPEPKNASKESRSPLKNIFDILEVYTPSEEFLNAPAADVPKTTPEAEYTVEEADTFGDAIFALVALLDDFTRLREEVRSLWKRHLEGSLDLAAAAVATNTAFELARSMEDEVKPLFDKHNGLTDIMAQYFRQMCTACGIDAEIGYAGDPYNLDVYDLAKDCWLNGATMLKAYAVGNAGDHIVSKYNGKFGWYDEEIGDSASTNRDKWEQDFTAFHGVITDLDFLSSNMGQGARIEDELIRGMGPLMNSTLHGGDADVRLWLCFALQTYIEVLQSFGKDCDKAYKQLQQEGRRIKKTMLDVPSTSAERNGVLKSVTKWDKDPMWECRQKMINLGAMAEPNAPRFQFLRRNPIHCGLLLHEMRANFHTWGVRYAAHSGGLMVTTQLYHALHNEKLLPEEVVWEDLDEFWKMQGNSAFFVGDPPKDREGYFRNYCLSLGVSASNWASNKKKGKVNVNTANRRNLKFNGWVSLAMKERLVPAGERQALSADMVEGILVEARRHEIMDGKGHVRPELKERAKNDEIGLIKLSPAGLIEKLALDVHDDVPKLTFDLFTLHNSAWELLKELKDEFTEVIGPEFTRFIPREELLPYVVGYTFSTAAGRADIQTKSESADVLIDAAAKHIGEFLEEGRGRVIKESSNVMVFPYEVSMSRLEFNGTDPWRLDKLMSDIQKAAVARGRRRGSDEEECPMQ
ncbi:hypothetical protein CDV36_014687 [Fusarium kuroshium]|uniref:DUF6604 domain-containing protein n=1 Tax=Fusarium kuroshium TaxID=2010991 RepID=A0A3M2RH24_9HYPO|nr:hypothetical protein CDV36_014687 [Fusarium kuroshium]